MIRGAVLVAALLILAGAPGYAQDMKLAQQAVMSRVKGSEEASVTVYEIADFQCPYCARFAQEVFPRIDSAYVKTGKVRWIYVNFPLPTHANSWAAAEAAMCAGGVSEQFWEMHDRLFARQADWSGATNPAPLFARYYRESGGAQDAFDACVKDDKLATLLVRDLLNATGAGASGTPAFIVNNEPIFAGYRAFEEWRAMIDVALRKPAAGK